MRSMQEIVAQFPDDAAGYAQVTGERREKFEAWMIELEAEHQKMGRFYGSEPIAEATGPMCWLSWFDDGYTPKEAIEEDLSNA
jgi:hypothetical protein